MYWHLLWCQNNIYPAVHRKPFNHSPLIDSKFKLCHHPEWVLSWAKNDTRSSSPHTFMSQNIASRNNECVVLCSSLKANSGYFFDQAVGVLVLWPAMVAMTAVASYYILHNVDKIDGLVGSSFAATAMLSCVNIVGAQCVMYTVAFERWHPRHVTKVCAPHLRLHLRTQEARSNGV